MRSLPTETIRAGCIFDVLELNREEYNRYMCYGASSAEKIEARLKGIVQGRIDCSISPNFDLMEATKDVSGLIIFLVNHSSIIAFQQEDTNAFQYALENYLSALSLFVYAQIRDMDVSDYALNTLANSPFILKSEIVLDTISEKVETTTKLSAIDKIRNHRNTQSLGINSALIDITKHIFADN